MAAGVDVPPFRDVPGEVAVGLSLHHCPPKRNSFLLRRALSERAFSSSCVVVIERESRLNPESRCYTLHKRYNPWTDTTTGGKKLWSRGNKSQ
jgi:hypothetical protein